MLRQIPTNQHERDLARIARQTAAGRDVLFHGTRHAKSILTTGVLFYSTPGDPGVFFTRSPEIAAYWALMDRESDEGWGAILIFDRQSLRCRYRVEPWHNPFCDDKAGRTDEMEERIRESVTDVGRHLIGYVTEAMTQYSPQTKTRNWTRRREIKARLLRIQPSELQGPLPILKSLRTDDRTRLAKTRHRYKRTG
jgi:hypothetical protein